MLAQAAFASCSRFLIGDFYRHIFLHNRAISLDDGLKFAQRQSPPFTVLAFLTALLYAEAARNKPFLFAKQIT